MTRILPFFLLIILCGCANQAVNDDDAVTPAGSSAASTAAVQPSDGSVAFDTEHYSLERVAEGLEVPWSIVFTSQQRMLVAERPGRVRVVENGVLRDEPLHMFNDVSSASEEGLMGLALHPDYASNKQVYLSYAYTSGREMFVRVVQMTDAGDRLTNNVTIIDTIPSAQNHTGCRLRFGPDGMLYITVGDATDRQIAQDMDSLGGKILRLTPDGDIPSDNPFPDSPVWSLGHRNPQGIDWHPETEQMFETEHGPSGFDGPGGGDEVNRIVKGGNYGWPVVSHERRDPRFADPLRVFTPAEAPASGTFYTGDLMPELYGHFFFGALRGEGIWQIVLSDDGARVVSSEKMSPGLGRIRDIATGPDGALYFSTSNRDGRGKAQPGDDAIWKLTPRR